MSDRATLRAAVEIAAHLIDREGWRGRYYGDYEWWSAWDAVLRALGMEPTNTDAVRAYEGTDWEARLAAAKQADIDREAELERKFEEAARRREEEAAAAEAAPPASPGET